MHLCRLAVLMKYQACDGRYRREAFQLRGPAMVTLDNRNVFSSLALLAALARSDAESQARPPAIMKEEGGLFKVIKTGAVLSKGAIRETYAAAVREASGIISDLLMGMGTPRSLDESVADNLAELRPGYMMQCKLDSEPPERNGDLLFFHAMRTPDLRRRFVDGSGSWRRAAVSELLRKYDRLVEAMMMIAHLGSGLPARATELASILRRNGQTSGRGLFWQGGRVFLMPSYNKTNSLTQRNRCIARFLPKEASQLFLIDQLLIRPFVSAAATSVGRNSENVYETHLWVRDGKRLTGPQIRQLVASGFHRYGQVRGTLSFGLYRHVAKFLAEETKIQALQEAAGDCDDAEDEEEEEELDMISKQMGHSSATGRRVYGLREGDLEHTRGSEMSMFRVVSDQWHECLGIHEPVLAPEPVPSQSVPTTPSARPPPALSPLRQTIIATPSPPSRTLPPSSLMRTFGPGELSSPATAARPIAHSSLSSGPVMTSTAQGSAVSTTAIADSVMPLKRSVEQDFDQDLAAGFPLRSYRDPKLPRFFASSEISLKAIQAWRIVNDDQQAGWRSVEQLRAAESILLGKTDMMIILPTGHGKTQLALMTAKATEAEGFTHVMIAPTVGLVLDVQKRAKACKITVSGNPSNATSEQLLVVTPEMVINESFVSCLCHLESMNRLGRIFVDECHMICTDGGWRLSMHNLYSLTRFQARLVLLSGTCPPAMQNELGNRIFPNKQPLIISKPSLRTNIALEAKPVESSAKMLSAVIELLTKVPAGDRAIVFCPFTNGAEKLSKDLRDARFSCGLFHGDLADDVKATALCRWNDGNEKLMVATSAFGVGIDAPNVRFVIMAGLPYGIFDLIQQVGRAGRDGVRAEAHVLYLPKDEECRFRKMSPLDKERFKAVLDFVSFGICRIRQISRYLQEPERCCLDGGIEGCDICAKVSQGTLHPFFSFAFMCRNDDGPEFPSPCEP